jgi:ADP-ribosylation factor GTPase-activating protein 2/3
VRIEVAGIADELTSLLYVLYGSSTAAPVADDAPTTARDRFGGQKAISSDMFFERGAYDPDTVSEGRARLAQFQGATSISSNQYFGREEEEALAQASDGGLLGDGSLAGFENAARDAVSRIMSNPDVQNLGDNIRSGALKVCHVFCVARGSPNA